MSTLQGGTQSFAGGTSDTQTTPYPHALGTRARDAVGNEYVYCNVGSATIAPEMAVLINTDWSLTAITTLGARGSVGVVADYAKSGNTSANVSAFPASVAVWVQVYGRAFVQVAGGGPSPSNAPPTTLLVSTRTVFLAPTSVISTPVGQLAYTSDSIDFTTINKFSITGMSVATDASQADSSGSVTAVSATHGGYSCAVWLNYPTIDHRNTIPSVT